MPEDTCSATGALPLNIDRVRRLSRAVGQVPQPEDSASNDIYERETTPHAIVWAAMAGNRSNIKEMAEITALLQQLQSGDADVLRVLIPLVYGELKKLASAHLRRERDVTPLQTTELVHEAFVRLSGSRHPSYENRSHFFGIASRLMRQVLVDMARSRARKKRAGEQIEMTEISASEPNPDRRLLLIDAALEQLKQTDAIKVQLLDMRYFGGMTAEESAEALSLSVHVVRRELRLAQAWLRKELSPVDVNLQELG